MKLRLKTRVYLNRNNCKNMKNKCITHLFRMSTRKEKLNVSCGEKSI